MARGDFTVFEEFAAQLGSENHSLNNDDTLKLGIIDDTVTPTAADTSPTWSDYSANEVSTAGNYTADGETLTTVSYTEVDGVATLDADNVVISQDGSGFTDAAFAILYNSTNASGMAIGFLDLGGPVSEQDGDVTIAWNASGILTVAVA
jgi:hypothetical protein